MTTNKTELPAGALNQPRGFLLEGINKGTKVKENVNQQTGEVNKTIFVGIGIPKDDGFDDELEIVQVKVPKTLVDAGFPGKFVQEKQSVVQLQVRVNHWEISGRSGVSISVANENFEVIKKAI